VQRCGAEQWQRHQTRPCSDLVGSSTVDSITSTLPACYSMGMWAAAAVPAVFSMALTGCTNTGHLPYNPAAAVCHDSTTHLSRTILASISGAAVVLVSAGSVC
jgi:hypothetical protein